MAKFLYDPAGQVTAVMMILVTGGAGFIGSHLVDRCVADGHAVRVIDDLSNSTRSSLKSHLRKRTVEFLKGDIRDRKLVRKAVRDVDALFHEAAQVSVPLSLDDPLYTDDVNVRGTLSLLIAARDEGVERFVYASSSSVYGDPASLPVKESSPLRPLSPYAASKIAAEAYCTSFHKSGGLSTVCLRYFNVFGLRQGPDGYASVIPAFIRSLLSGRPMTIFGDGTQTRDFIHVGDVVEANTLALTADMAIGEAINIGSGKSVSISELANMLREISGTRSPAPVHVAARKGDVKHSVADITNARRLLGHTPRTDLRSNLESLFKSYRQHFENKKR